MHGIFFVYRQMKSASDGDGGGRKLLVWRYGKEIFGDVRSSPQGGGYTEDFYGGESVQNNRLLQDASSAESVRGKGEG